MPHYQCLLTATCIVLVEADSEEDALDIAVSEASSGDYEFCEGESEGLIPPEELKARRFHADLEL
ncbi:TPA: hypothetical protein L6A55_25710 [Pseudomonas aeruginosa]|uniref:hypothetical protein n=1 Tax=Pseudomonas aeruginosa TaxID=287 RepID=UPI00053E5FBF|nr:hypothetical protein [Pseudomonas aeruginosa]HBP5595349.1 hypothetical protein [Pseudomonas aeruginosa]HBP5634252.1 hypothetical protein [Pseudomonas aeruginosa]HBP5640759.1 hypothetical protein [Pseudomonas aeruginosa]HBP5679574.1 hypothetical protein [Pseudomonas aeruginosa]HBP5947365.1 hypothetical protein [Pseudomonas aeruginosa]